MKRYLPGILLLTFVSFIVSFNLRADGGAATLAQWQSDAAQGNPDAQYNLGLAYAQGTGVEKDYAKAAEYYTKAAEQGNVNAQYNLGTLCINGEGIPKDPDAGVRWFTKAAQQGDMNAAHSLADILYDKKNYDAALPWFRKAADAGIADAQFGLGLMYDLGQGVPEDHAQALIWYGKAAVHGSAPAVCNIGILYYNGEGVPVDRAIAHQYFAIADAMGEPRAKDLMQFTTEKLSKKQIERAVAQAEEWMQVHPMKSEPAPVPMTVPAVSNASM